MFLICSVYSVFKENENYPTTFMAATQQPEKLNSMQLHLLRFFSEHQVSEQETAEIQQLIASYYARKADARMDEIWAEKGFTDQNMDEILNGPLKKPAQS